MLPGSSAQAHTCAHQGVPGLIFVDLQQQVGAWAPDPGVGVWGPGTRALAQEGSHTPGPTLARSGFGLTGAQGFEEGQTALPTTPGGQSGGGGIRKKSNLPATRRLVWGEQVEEGGGPPFLWRWMPLNRSCTYTQRGRLCGRATGNISRFSRGQE